jgi:hypothetical protein
MKKTILLVLLGLNAVAQLGGGIIMTALPAKAAVDIFHVSATPEGARLLAVIGGAVLGYSALGCVCMLWVARGRRAGFELARALGLLTIGVGIIMLATGTSAGTIDVLKGAAIAIAAWWAVSDVAEPATA